MNKPPRQEAILKAVASSTAIETGVDIKTIQNKLNNPYLKFAFLKLASKRDCN